MRQWLTFESDAVGPTNGLKVFICDPTENDLVTFYANMKDGADFTREEAISICRELLKLLDADICN